MDIRPETKTVRDLLGSKRQFIIPRFQREYSWEKKHYQEFFEDMINGLEIKDGIIKESKYFLGTMLFIGDFTDSMDKKINVVDGQQRLTTITILFSALSDRFKQLNEIKLSEQIFQYVMTEDDNGDSIKILKSKSSYPFFANYIQDIEKKYNEEVSTEEEKCIKKTYLYFKRQLKLNNLKILLGRKFKDEEIKDLKEIDILKALREQILNSLFVSISTKTKEQANNIFAILNSKGKRLADIDLIKNKIFEKLNTQEPADFAQDTWKKIKDTLISIDDDVGFTTFYRHYWNSKFKKTSANKLYDAFIKEYGKKDENEYMNFLKDLLYNANLYIKVVSPKREDYTKDLFIIPQSLNIIINKFNVVQVRIALLSLFVAKEKGVVSNKNLKRVIKYMENFHFAYNAVVSGRANKFEQIYCKFARNIRKAEDKNTANQIIENDLIKPLDRNFPSFEEFCEKFICLKYSTNKNLSEEKTKYAINKINCYFSDKELFEDDGSIEHIIPKINDDDKLFNIGNLILLEQRINNGSNESDYETKKDLYEDSNYKWVKAFCEKYPNWDSCMIEDRARNLAKLYYSEILGKEIEKQKEEAII